jgi:molybdate transport system ATP-binding protein
MISIDIQKQFSEPPTTRAQEEVGAALSGVSASFESNARVLGIFGKSGSGKTTLVNLIAGIDTPTRGRIAVDEVVLFDGDQGVNRPMHERAIGYVFQDASLFPHLSVERNLRYGMPARQLEGAGVGFDSVVKLLGIGALLSRKPHTLSGGEKQRVAIGRALLSNPRLLLMDEPLASLDQNRRNEILKLIEQVRDRFGTRIVYVSHSIAEISRLADEVLLMNEGALLAHGSTETIFNRRDLRPYTGRYEGGALIEATVTGHDPQYFLSTLSFSGGQLVTPGIDVPVGTRVRVRVRARDVSLAIEKPSGISIRNILLAEVLSIDDQQGAIVEVHVRLGDTTLLARISRLACVEMNVAVGRSVFVLLKAIAFDKRSIGYSGT